MAGKHCYDYPRPSVTVDLVVLRRSESGTEVLLIRRKRDPFAGRWAIPGGFLEIEEPFESGARRELKEETGIEIEGPVAFLGVYGNPGRDPRGRTISIAHVAEVKGNEGNPVGADDADFAEWVDVESARDLAFDHDAMLHAALAWLADRG